MKYNKKYLQEAYFATCIEANNGKLESYKKWLERQLISRLKKIDILEKKLNKKIITNRKSLLDLFAQRLDKIFDEGMATKAQIYDAIHKSIDDMERI